MTREPVLCAGATTRTTSRLHPGRTSAPGIRRLAAPRANRSRRRAAAKMALLDWLYQQDAVREINPPARESMLKSPEHGVWHGQPFSDEDDLDYAAAWLFRKGFVKGHTVDEQEGPVLLYLTDTGVTCADEYASDSDAYLRARSRPQAGNFSLTVAGDSNGCFLTGVKIFTIPINPDAAGSLPRR